jgi:hypothetical protein
MRNDRLVEIPKFSILNDISAERRAERVEMG